MLTIEAGGESAGSSWQLPGEKGAQNREAPGTGPKGVPKKAIRVGVQWVVKG